MNHDAMANARSSNLGTAASVVGTAVNMTQHYKPKRSSGIGVGLKHSIQTVKPPMPGPASNPDTRNPASDRIVPRSPPQSPHVQGNLGLQTHKNKRGVPKMRATSWGSQ